MNEPQQPTPNDEPSEKQRADQMALNCRWLMAQIDRIHDALCPGKLGTWQQMAEQSVEAAERLSRHSWVEWKPIESAPENVPLLLYCPDLGAPNPERIEIECASRGSYFSDGSRCPGTWSYHAWATHWAPQPFPPKKPTQ